MADRILTDWLQAYLEYTDNTEPAVTFRYWTGLSTIASALQRKCKLQLGPYEQYPNLYVILVAPPGAGRKTTALRPAQKLMRLAGIPIAAEAITREALIKELAGKSAPLPHIDPRSGRPHHHCSLTIASDEWAVFLGRQNEILMSDLCNWFDCPDRWTYRTKNSDSFDMIGVWVNMIGCTTPVLLNKRLPEEAIGGGLTSRTIFVYEDSHGKDVEWPALTAHEKELEEALVSDLKTMTTLCGEYQVPDDVVTYYKEWFHSSYKNPPSSLRHEYFASYCERRRVQLLKLCMVHSASRTNSLEIDVSDYERSVTILHETERKMHHTFAGFGRQQYIDVLNNVTKFLLINKQVNYSHLLRTFKQDVDSDELDRIIRTLKRMGRVSEHRRGPEVVLVYHDQPLKVQERNQGAPG